MPTKLKLANPGDECVMLVEKIEPIEGSYGADIAFTGDAGDDKVTVYVPAKTAQGRMEHLGISDWDELVGKTVKISRSVKLGKNGKPFWDIETSGAKATGAKVNGNGSNGNGTAPKVAPMTDEERKAKKIAALKQYLDLFDYVAKHQSALAQQMAEAGTPLAFDANSVNAATASIWIQLDRRGLI